MYIYIYIYMYIYIYILKRNVMNGICKLVYTIYRSVWNISVHFPVSEFS